MKTQVMACVIAWLVAALVFSMVLVALGFSAIPAIIMSTLVSGLLAFGVVLSAGSIMIDY